jgi:protein-disulfide isomerase
MLDDRDSRHTTQRWLATVTQYSSLCLTGVIVAFGVLSAATQHRLLARLSSVEGDIAKLKHERTFAASEGGSDSLPKLAVPVEPVSLHGAPLKGRRGSQIALIEFVDFECDFCGTFFRETLPRLEREYVETGKVLLAFRHLPLLRMHAKAERAAIAAECANRQSRFWEMHDMLFRNQGDFGTPMLESYAAAVGIERRSFKTCLDGDILANIRSDIASADKLGVSATPTFLVGTVEKDGRVKVLRVLVGARPFNEFSSVLDDVIKANQKL